MNNRHGFSKPWRFVLKKIVLLQTFLKNDNYGKVF